MVFLVSFLFYSTSFAGLDESLNTNTKLQHILVVLLLGSILFPNSSQFELLTFTQLYGYASSLTLILLLEAQ